MDVLIIWTASFSYNKYKVLTLPCRIAGVRLPCCPTVPLFSYNWRVFPSIDCSASLGVICYFYSNPDTQRDMFWIDHPSFSQFQKPVSMVRPQITMDQNWGVCLWFSTNILQSSLISLWQKAKDSCIVREPNWHDTYPEVSHWIKLWISIFCTLVLPLIDCINHTVSGLGPMGQGWCIRWQWLWKETWFFSIDYVFTQSGSFQMFNVIWWSSCTLFQI